MAGFNLDNYVPVEERIEVFYREHPQGSLQTEIVHLDPTLVVVKALAYRTPDDPRPATGHSQLNIPGGTSFTKGSEVENAETSAVGRALALMGFEVRRGVASQQEVRNKQREEPPPPEHEAQVLVYRQFFGQCKALGIGQKLICEALGNEPANAQEASDFLANRGAEALAKWMADNPDSNWTNLVSRLADKKAAQS